jgi:cytoskeletal protein CcmA (bactofilin family)
MFGKERSSGFNPNSANTTLIAAGTEIQGNIKFTGNLEIEGKVIGDIAADDSGVATVRVLEHGEVEGNLRVPTVIVNGTVKGDVFANEHIELAAKAKVTGDVHYSLIEMVKGAQVNGNLVYSGDRGAQVTSIKGTKLASGSDDATN